MNQIGKSLFASLALFAIPFLYAHADDFDFWNAQDFAYPARPRAGFHAVERIGITLGGDVISKLAHADGTIREISAGGLYQAGLGALYQWDVIPVSAALTINYHYDSDYNGNDDASFRRNPLEALVYVNGPGNFRFGAGMRYVYAARAESTINGVTEKINFENARGSIIEIGYQVEPYSWVSLRYVKEIYRVETYTITGTPTTGAAPPLAGNAPYDGSHVGLFISYEY